MVQPRRCTAQSAVQRILDRGRLDEVHTFFAQWHCAVLRSFMLRHSHVPRNPWVCYDGVESRSSFPLSTAHENKRASRMATPHTMIGESVSQLKASMRSDPVLPEPVIFLPLRCSEALSTLQSAVATQEAGSILQGPLALLQQRSCSSSDNGSLRGSCNDDPVLLLPLRCSDAALALEEALEAMSDQERQLPCDVPLSRVLRDSTPQTSRKMVSSWGEQTGTLVGETMPQCASQQQGKQRQRQQQFPTCASPGAPCSPTAAVACGMASGDSRQAAMVAAVQHPGTGGGQMPVDQPLAGQPVAGAHWTSGLDVPAMLKGTCPREDWARIGGNCRSKLAHGGVSLDAGLAPCRNNGAHEQQYQEMPLGWAPIPGRQFSSGTGGITMHGQNKAPRSCIMWGSLPLQPQAQVLLEPQQKALCSQVQQC